MSERLSRSGRCCHDKIEAVFIGDTATITIANEIMDAVNKMTVTEQYKVLAFIKGDVSAAYGIPAEEFMARARELNFDPVALDEMEAAINDAFGYKDENDSGANS